MLLPALDSRVVDSRVLIHEYIYLYIYGYRGIESRLDWWRLGEGCALTRFGSRCRERPRESFVYGLFARSDDFVQIDETHTSN